MSLSLCNKCKQGALECEFMADLIPVEGWTAVKTVTGDGNDSYHVTKCPKYEKMRRDPAREALHECCVCGKEFMSERKGQIRCKECMEAKRLPNYKPLKK